MYFTSLLAILPVAVLALQVTSPSKGTTWDSTQGQTVTFSAVSTDPKLVNIVLVNMNTYPTVSTTVGESIDTSSGSFEIPASKMAGLSSMDGYQINLVSRDNNGILAQSGTFEIEESGESDTPVTVTANASQGTGSSHGAPTVTVTQGSAGTSVAHSTTSGTATRPRTSSGTVTGTATETTTSATYVPNSAPALAMDKGGVLAVALGVLAAVI